MGKKNRAEELTSTLLEWNGVPARARLYLVCRLPCVSRQRCQLAIHIMAGFKQSQFIHYLRVRLEAMAVYLPVTFRTDLDAVSGIDSQDYQAWGLMAAKLALHFVPLSVGICPRRAQKRGIPPPHRARIPLQKTQKGGYLAAFLCVASVSVKRSRLLLLSLSFGFAWASP